MATLSYRQIPDAIAARQEFQGNSMRGKWYQPDSFGPEYGSLPSAELAQIRQAWADAKRFHEPLYVIHSYYTPIAWALSGRKLYVPDVRYSVTTSRQQSLVRGAA